MGAPRGFGPRGGGPRGFGTFSLEFITDWYDDGDHEFAVVGYDNSKLAQYTNPPLTSVHQDGVQMGREAVRLLMQCIDNPDAAVEPVIIEPTLTVRRSCGEQT